MLWDFYKGDNPSGEPIPMNSSLHVQYSFMFPKGSRLGETYPTSYQGIGLAPYTFFNHGSVGFPVALYVFQGGSPQSGEPRSFIKDMDLDLFLHTGYMFRGLYYPQHLMLGIGWSFGR